MQGGFLLVFPINKERIHAEIMQTAPVSIILEKDRALDVASAECLADRMFAATGICGF